MSRSRTDQWLDSEGSLLPYAFFRIILGFMLWRHAWLFLENYLRLGHYTNRFYLPYIEWYTLPGDAAYLAPILLMILGGSMLIIGFRVREASILSFTSLTLHFFLNQIWYRHNRYFFLLLLILLIAGPGREVFSLSVRQSFHAVGKTWSYAMVRLQMSITYLASSFAKTLDPDWRGGGVLVQRLKYISAENPRPGEENLPGTITYALDHWISAEKLGVMLTYMALFQEYFLGICLWIPKTRKLAIWVGVIFHGSIEVGSHVLVFSYVTLATYFLVIRPTVKDRKLYFDPRNKFQAMMARVIFHLDWLSKVDLYETKTNALVVEDKDGKRYRGWMAHAVVGSCLVIPFMIVYPLTWLKHLGIGRSEEKISEGSPITGFPLMVTPKIVLITILIIMGAYQTLVYLGAERYIDLSLKDLRYIDLPLIFLFFYLLTIYYRAREANLKAT